MSDAIKHECGLAFIRLKKPFSYYLQQYNSCLYGINKLYLLMEKQHNRGQDGAGMATVKLDVEQGNKSLFRIRSAKAQPIADIFFQLHQQVEELCKYLPGAMQHPNMLKGNLPFLGELLLGHLRYGTQGKNKEEFCHPFIKLDVEPCLNIALAGNFNLVNTDELYEKLQIEPGDFQKQSDLAAMLEVIHHQLVQQVKNKSWNLQEALQNAAQYFDGGFTVGGLLGNGDSFVFRDAHGIRPAYFFENDDVIVAASERAAIRTTFNVEENEVEELMPGQGLIISKDCVVKKVQILPAKERRACSFERIYFSRGSDEKIYRERIKLGHLLSKSVLEFIQYDLKNTIFSYIPNTAEVAFFGLVKGMEEYLNEIKVKRILSWGNDIDESKLEELINRKIRQEKIAIKDVKLRTFISADMGRNEMVQHVYDITYGTVKPHQDTLVVIDDSIVRGTTLKESIIRMLARLKPKQIVIISSAPQIRYPDCYGIDMSKLGDFVAFKAAIQWLNNNGHQQIIQDVYDEILLLKQQQKLHSANVVKKIYKPISTDILTEEITKLITPTDLSIPVKIIFQTIEDLHTACPTNTGDWYFTGNYPTDGGNKVCNMAFLNYMEGKNVRAY